MQILSIYELYNLMSLCSVHWDLFRASYTRNCRVSLWLTKDQRLFSSNFTLSRKQGDNCAVHTRTIGCLHYGVFTVLLVACVVEFTFLGAVQRHCLAAAET
eukprot:c26031_g3_i2 orf=462-764(-)